MCTHPQGQKADGACREGWEEGLARDMRKRWKEMIPRCLTAETGGRAHMPRFIKLHTSDMCRALCVNYTSIKLFLRKANKAMGKGDDEPQPWP